MNSYKKLYKAKTKKIKYIDIDFTNKIISNKY